MATYVPLPVGHPWLRQQIVVSPTPFVDFAFLSLQLLALIVTRRSGR